MSQTLTRCLFFAVLLQVLALNDESSADPIAMSMRGLEDGARLTDFETKLIVTYENPTAQKTMESLENDFKVMLTEPNSVEGLRCLSSNVRYIVNSKVGGDNVIEIAKAIGFILRDEIFDRTLTELITVAEQIIDIPDSHRSIRFLFRVANKLLTRPNIDQFFRALAHEINKFANEVDANDVHFAFTSKTSFLRKNWKLLIARNRKRTNTNVETRSLDENEIIKHSHERKLRDVDDRINRNEHDGQEFYQYTYSGKVQGWSSKGSDRLAKSVLDNDVAAFQTDDKNATEGPVKQKNGKQAVEDMTNANDDDEEEEEEEEEERDNIGEEKGSDRSAQSVLDNDATASQTDDKQATEDPVIENNVERTVEDVTTEDEGKKYMEEETVENNGAESREASIIENNGENVDIQSDGKIVEEDSIVEGGK